MGSLATAQQQPQLREEVIVRWWLVPVYAIDKAGAPVLNLSASDLEVYIKNIKVVQFTLHKKEFKVTEAKKGAAAAQPNPSLQPQAPPRKKMVFLVFDAAATPMALLAKAKTICDEVLARSDKSAQYVLLSIEPLAGLHYISGPTSVKAVGREKSFADMNELEKEVLILNVLNRGPFALTKEKVIPVEVKAAREGGQFAFRLTLPAELARSEYTVFKVARNFEKGDIRIDKETVNPESPAIEVRMKWRGKGYRHDIVIAHAKTGTILVAK
jgi:hypothetical protein